jgi:hypothetical protein
MDTNDTAKPPKHDKKWHRSTFGTLPLPGVGGEGLAAINAEMYRWFVDACKKIGDENALRQFVTVPRALVFRDPECECGCVVDEVVMADTALHVLRNVANKIRETKMNAAFFAGGPQVNPAALVEQVDTYPLFLNETKSIVHPALDELLRLTATGGGRFDHLTMFFAWPAPFNLMRQHKVSVDGKTGSTNAHLLTVFVTTIALDRLPLDAVIEKMGDKDRLIDAVAYNRFIDTAAPAHYLAKRHMFLYMPEGELDMNDPAYAPFKWEKTMSTKDNIDLYTSGVTALDVGRIQPSTKE